MPSAKISVPPAKLWFRIGPAGQKACRLDEHFMRLHGDFMSKAMATIRCSFVLEVDKIPQARRVETNFQDFLWTPQVTPPVTPVTHPAR